MKIGTLLSFVFAFNLSASIFSQSTKFTLNTENKTIKEVFKSIEAQSKFRFFYNDDFAYLNEIADISIVNMAIDEILNQLIVNNDVTYKVLENNLIVITPKENVQQQKLTGRVSDATSGETLPGVYVIIEGTNTGTITDSDGNYALEVPPLNSVLVFSYMGYVTEKVVFDGKSVIDMTLVVDIQNLEEVVITALGIKKEAKALSYSSSEIKADELGQTSDANIMNSLSGKLAGVDISTIGTGIAGSSRVTIRGNTTINGDSNPLYVIDGIQIDRASLSANNRDFGDVLNTINSDDIESISVLKGAAATALYGSQAANGVVLITTKKGTKKQGLGITYSGSFGYDEYVNPFRNRQTTYGVGVEGKKPDINLNGWGYNAHQEWGAKYDGSEAYYPDNSTPVPWGYSYHESPWDAFTRRGFFMSNAIALSGGTSTQNYRLSVSDMRQQSPLPNSDMNRQTISLNTSSDYGKRFHVDAKIDYSTMSVKNRPNTQSYVWTLGHMPTMWDLDWAKGPTSKIGANEAGKMLPWSTNEYYHNPYWAAYQNEARDKRDRLNGFVSGNFDITDWLSATGRLGADFNVTKARTVEAYGAMQFAQGTGQVDEFTDKNVRWNADYSLLFDKDIHDFNVNAMFGGSLTQSSNNRDGLTGTKLSIPNYHEVTNASVLTTNVAYSEYGINSLYGSVEVSYKNYVYLTGTGRNDWFSSLSPTNNSIFYPSVGISYIFSQQFKMPDWITFGKLRGSYARVGGGASPYMTKFGYTSNALGYNGYPLLTLPTTIPKSDLMPYETREFELGLDLRFFDNRVSIDYAYYDKLTKNDIVSASTSPSTGYTGATVNLGKMSNKGHEVMLNLVPVKGELTWDLTFTYTHNVSEVLDLGGVHELQVAGYGDAAGVTVKQIVGERFSSIVGYPQAIDAASGQPIWYWNASRGIWFPQKTSEPQVLGSGLHPNMGSLSTSVNYKGFVLSTMVDAKWGAKVFSYSEWDMTARGHSKRTVTYRENGIPVQGVYLDAVGNYVPLDHDTNIPYAKNNFENYYRYAMGDLVDYNVFDASYVKLRQISLGYTLPKSILKNGIIQSVQVTLVGRNICNLYNKLPNGDASTLTNNGLERFALPTTRTFMLDFNLSF